MADHHFTLSGPVEDEKRRIIEMLREVGGRNLAVNTNDILDVLKLEYQMKAQKMATDRIVLVSWVLAGATVVLAIATVALIFATLEGA